MEYLLIHLHHIMTSAMIGHDCHDMQRPNNTSVSQEAQHLAFTKIRLQCSREPTQRYTWASRSLQQHDRVWVGAGFLQRFHVFVFTSTTAYDFCILAFKRSEVVIPLIDRTFNWVEVVF